MKTIALAARQVPGSENSKALPGWIRPGEPELAKDPPEKVFLATQTYRISRTSYLRAGAVFECLDDVTGDGLRDVSLLQLPFDVVDRCAHSSWNDSHSERPEFTKASASALAYKLSSSRIETFCDMIIHKCGVRVVCTTLGKR